MTKRKNEGSKQLRKEAEKEGEARDNRGDYQGALTLFLDAERTWSLTASPFVKVPRSDADAP